MREDDLVTGTHDQAPPTRTVAVCGSCTSRDNFSSRFNAGYARWFTVSADVFQTSMISLMSPPLPAPTQPGEETYQQRITREDVTRVFLDKIAAAPPDYLGLDFFADIHFGVLGLPDGSVITNNRWMLWPTEYYATLKAAGGLEPARIFDDPDAYLARWSEAMDRFAAFVAEHCPQTRVIVHRGLNTNDVVVPGQARPVRLRTFRKVAPLNVARANKLWARLDDYAISTYGWDSIDLRAEHYTSYAEHPWKAFYVHYNPDYYHRFLAELHVLDLQSRLDPGTWERVRDVAAAGHEHAVREATFWQALVAEQDRRIHELEHLGPLRAVKFALGRRLRETRARRQQRPAASPRAKES